MARNKSNKEGINWTALMTEEDLFKELLRDSIQQYLEAEMERCWERRSGSEGKAD